MVLERKRGSIEKRVLKKAKKRAKVIKNKSKTVKEQVTNDKTCRKCCKETLKSNCVCENDRDSEKTKRLPNNELSLVDRIRLIEEYEESKKSLRVLAEEFCVGKSTVARILKNREDIRKEYESDNVNLARCRKKRKTESEFVNVLLWKFFQQCKANKVFVSGPMLQRKARSLALDQGYDNFKASNGWLSTFKKVHGIQLPYPKVVGTVSKKQNGNKHSEADDLQSQLPKVEENDSKISSNDAVSDKASIGSETERISVSSLENSNEVNLFSKDTTLETTMHEDVTTFYASDDSDGTEWNHRMPSFKREQQKEQVNGLKGSEMTQEQMMNLVKTAYNYAISNDETLLIHVMNLQVALQASIERERNSTNRNTTTRSCLW